MPSLLWFSNETPDRGGQGGQRRQFFLLQSLLQDGFRVRVVTLAGPQSDTSVRELTDVHRIPSSSRRNPLQVARNIRLVLSLDEFEGIILSHDVSWPFGRLFSRIERAPVFMDLHNVTSAWYGARHEWSRQKSFLRLEKRILKGSDVVSVVAQREVEELPHVSGSRVEVIEHGVDPAEWVLSPIAPQCVVRLFGNWFWDPNRSGLEWFAHEVWPLVQRESPEWRCEVAGMGVVPNSLGGGIGRVTSLNHFLRSAAVIAVPVRNGVGAPLKYLEALVTGVPVVATKDGAHGSDISGSVVSDDPAVWAEFILRSARSQRVREEATKTRAKVLAEATWYRRSQPLREWAASVSREGM